MYCPRCDKEVMVPIPGAMIYCFWHPYPGCFIVEHYFELLKENTMPTTDELLTERGKTHGNYNNHAGITQQIKQLMRMGEKWKALTFEQRESLEMIAHKIGRIIAGDPNHRDHWLDISGYAMLVANRCPNDK